MGGIFLLLLRLHFHITAKSVDWKAPAKKKIPPQSPSPATCLCVSLPWMYSSQGHWISSGIRLTCKINVYFLLEQSLDSSYSIRTPAPRSFISWTFSHFIKNREFVTKIILIFLQICFGQGIESWGECDEGGWNGKFSASSFSMLMISCKHIDNLETGTILQATGLPFC